MDTPFVDTPFGPAQFCDLKQQWNSNGLLKGTMRKNATSVHTILDVFIWGRAKGAAKASCGETVVQKGVFGESVSSLLP